jgi:carbon storage regulator
MLVLSRKKNESIVVDDAIVITVLEIRGDKVRLGIDAPKSVPIHRSEVYAAIQGQAAGEASAIAADDPQSHPPT